MMHKSSIRFLPPVILAAALVAVSSASPAPGRDKNHFSALRMVRFSKPVATPDFKLKDLEGSEVSFSRFKGKVILLNFWTTW
jgi:cytochrome oxidase Cu insertion factor (SCO1/SenC/PrrC family)